MKTFYLFLLFLLSITALRADVKGDDITKKILTLPDFHSIALNSNYTINLSQTNKQEIEVQALTEIFAVSEFKVENGVLIVNIKRTKDDSNKSIWAKIDNIKVMPTMYLNISVKDVKNLTVNGGGKIISKNSIASDNLNLAVNGPGSIDLDVKGKNVMTTISGSGSIKLKGYTTVHNASLSGSGTLNSYDFKAEDANAKVSGSGICEIYVANSLLADVFGPGKIYHKGNTKKVTQNLYGSGLIDRAY